MFLCLKKKLQNACIIQKLCLSLHYQTKAAILLHKQNQKQNLMFQDTLSNNLQISFANANDSFFFECAATAYDLDFLNVFLDGTTEVSSEGTNADLINFMQEAYTLYGADLQKEIMVVLGCLTVDENDDVVFEASFILYCDETNYFDDPAFQEAHAFGEAYQGLSYALNNDFATLSIQAFV